MSRVLALGLLPLLLVFGVYHLSLWMNLLRVRSMVFWRRTALASAVSHVAFSAGLFLFSYLDYRANGAIAGPGLAFDAFLFTRPLFWSLLALFDTLGMLLLLGLFGLLEGVPIRPGITVWLTIGTVLVVGTVQWYWIGGGIGAVVERLWSGLKGPDEDDGPGNWPGP
jgi:hypothetical protein